MLDRQAPIEPSSSMSLTTFPGAQTMSRVWSFQSRLIKDVLMPRSKSFSGLKDILHHRAGSVDETVPTTTTTPKARLLTKDVKVVTRQDILNGVYRNTSNSSKSKRPHHAASLTRAGGHNKSYSSRSSSRSQSPKIDTVIRQHHRDSHSPSYSTPRSSRPQIKQRMVSDDGLLLVPLVRSLTRESQASTI